MLRFFSAFRAFDLLPAGQHFGAVFSAGIAKDVRVAAFQLIADGGTDIVEIKAPFFLGHLRVKHHLEQQVTQFAAQIVKIFPGDSVQHFVGLFQGVGGDSGESLLFVPRTAGFRVAQALHNAEQAVNLIHNSVLIKKMPGGGCALPGLQKKV